MKSRPGMKDHVKCGHAFVGEHGDPDTSGCVAYATVGEVCDTLAETFGKYRGSRGGI